MVTSGIAFYFIERVPQDSFYRKLLVQDFDKSFGESEIAADIHFFERFGSFLCIVISQGLGNIGHDFLTGFFETLSILRFIHF